MSETIVRSLTAINADNFTEKCLETFYYQYENVEVYRKFVDFLGKKVDSVKKIEDIPFLPIEIFKNHKVSDKNFDPKFYFQSSGTSQMTRSQHWIADENMYKKSILESFQLFIGDLKEYVILGLLPSYSENSHSSLIYMVDFLMEQSGHTENNYFLYDHEALLKLLNELCSNKTKVILFGVSFALLDFLEYIEGNPQKFAVNDQLTIIETGGMKGRKEEITKDELLNLFKEGFQTEKIFSEYSMTELLSQAYSLGDNLYQTPPWMAVKIRNTEDPFHYLENGRSGAVNMIDLANLHSCSFIATQDLGKIEVINGEEYFSVLGRIDHSDIRGCSLLVS